MKIGYQLKQVRERLAKGLVDKGILRTEKRNFLLFDMATHPVADGGAKDELRRRVRAVLTNRTVVLPPSSFLPAEMDFRYLRTIAMLCAAYAANVLENALVTLGHEARERAFSQVDELLAEYSQWPFAKRAGGNTAAIGANLDQVVREEINQAKDKELQLEVRQKLLHWFKKRNYKLTFPCFSGRCCMLKCVYSLGFIALGKRRNTYTRWQDNAHCTLTVSHLSKPISPELLTRYRRRPHPIPPKDTASHTQPEDWCPSSS